MAWAGWDGDEVHFMHLTQLVGQVLKHGTRHCSNNAISVKTFCCLHYKAFYAVNIMLGVDFKKAPFRLRFINNAECVKTRKRLICHVNKL